MRHLLLLVPAALGCAAPCPSAPESLNRQVWRIFNKPVQVLDPPVADYPDGSPVSGYHDLFIQWGSNAEKSQVTVGMDGNQFSGTGLWNPDECGNFQIAFGGLYHSESASTHAIQVNGWMQTWDGHLEGEWHVTENWKYDDEEGTSPDEWTVQVIGTP